MRLMLSATVKRSAAIAAILAVMTVEAPSGSGPSTIASRRSNDSESHITPAITPTATIEYMMNTVAMRRVSGSSICGNLTAAASNVDTICSGMNSAGTSRNASGPAIARRSCIADVTDSLAKNCATNARQRISNRPRRRGGRSAMR